MSPTIRRAGAIVLYSRQLDATVAFYQRLGLPLVEETHDDGVRHYACEVGDLHFAIFAAAGGTPAAVRAHGATMFDFEVDSAAEVVRVADELGATVMLREPQEVEWGRRVILLDPDGREVQFFEPKDPTG